MDYDNLKINNGALIAWGCVIHKTLLADVSSPLPPVIFLKIKCEKVEIHTHKQKIHMVVIYKNACLVFRYLEISYRTCKTILTQKLILKIQFEFFFLLNSVFFFYGSRNVCKQENIFCICMEIKIQKNIIIFNYLTSAGLSMQLGNPLTCP